MSLYSRYSESSISVSYFSRSSALICSDVLLRRQLGTRSHLSSPISAPLGRRVRFAFGHHPRPRRGCHAPDVDERIALLGAGPHLRQRRGVRRRAVALVL